MSVNESLKRVLSDTPLYPFAKVLDDTLVEPIRDRYVARSLFPSGFHQVTPTVEDVSSFELWVTGRGQYQRDRIRGNLEPHVMETMADSVDDDTTFWDVGAAWGYFSMAAAETADRVFAFEVRRELVEQIRRSAERNGYDNVTAVHGTVGEDVDLGRYPTPDFVVMDIEGWEYEALSSNPELLAAEPTLVIEVHGPEMVDASTVPVRRPGELESLLTDSGYAIERLGERSSSNYHVLARPAE